jgi:O-antigen/teichoic acid export membrane protein
VIRTVLGNRILSAYSTSLLAIASGLLTNFWLLREITFVISPQDFGVYAYVMQICAYLPLLQLGIDFAGMRHISQSLGRKDPAEANDMFAGLLLFNHAAVVIGIVVVAALSAALWRSPAWLGVLNHEGAAYLAAQICLVAGTAQNVAFLSRPYSAALMASENQATANIVIVLRTVSTTAIAFGLLKFGFYIFSVPVAEIITQCFNYFVLRALARKRCKWLESRRHSAFAMKYQAMMPLVKYGAITSLGGVAWTVESGADVLILGYLSTPQIVASYFLWWRFPQMLYDLCTRLSFSAFPSLSHNLGASKGSAVVLLRKVGDASSGLATLAFVGISIWLPSFMHIWIGAGYAPMHDELIPVLMGLLVCLRTWGNLFGLFWLALGRTGLGAALSWCQAIVKVCLGLWLGGRYGISGLLIASCVAATLQVAVTGFHLYRSNFLNTAIVLRLGFLLALATCVVLLGMLHPPNVGWLEFLLGVVATALCWGAVWFMVALLGDLKTRLLSLLGTINVSQSRLLR